MERLKEEDALARCVLWVNVRPKVNVCASTRLHPISRFSGTVAGQSYSFRAVSKRCEFQRQMSLFASFTDALADFVDLDRHVQPKPTAQADSVQTDEDTVEKEGDFDQRPEGECASPSFALPAPCVLCLRPID